MGNSATFSRPFSAVRSTSIGRVLHLQNRGGRPNLVCINALMGEEAYLGIDFGTSGARCFVLNAESQVLATSKTPYASDAPSELGKAWSSALLSLLQDLPADVKRRVAALAIDGTSGTSLLVDAHSGVLLQPPKLYNEAQEAYSVQLAKEMAPKDHTATASTSTLCKVLTWHEQGAWQAAAAEGRRPIILHQADWLAFLLHGKPGVSDWNNCLKAGFDPGREEWPGWLADLAHLLPQLVCAPGTPVAAITAEMAAKTGLPPNCVVCSGTTDSIAAFLAAGVSVPGEAVTSLGSTLAVKLLSEQRIDDVRFGVYSHRLGDEWLVGGASNAGGAVLRSFFTDTELTALTQRMDASTCTGLDYVVLGKAGERFPVNDPQLKPLLEPRPADSAVFLQGMLEAMARTEAQAYRVLQELGATPVRKVYTAGGGVANPVWRELREKALGVPVVAAAHGDAAYGAALLAKQGYGLLNSGSVALKA